MKKISTILLSFLLGITPAFAGRVALIKADQISGIQAVRNYLKEYAHGEKNANGWVISKNTSATAAPDNGFVTTSTSNTFTKDTATTMSGDGYFLYTLAALGNQVCVPFSADPTDTYKVLQGSFDYGVSSGTYTSGDATVWIYDVTAASFIQPAPYSLINHTQTSERFSFEFQGGSGSSYKLCIHQAAASTAVLRIDNVFVGRSAKAFGSPVTDAVSWTPTYSSSMNNPTNTSVNYRRVGDEFIARMKITLGGSITAATAAIDLPNGWTVNSSKIASGVKTVVGYWTSTSTTGSQPKRGTVLAEGGSATLTFSIDDYTNTTSPHTSQNATAMWVNGLTLSINFSVPITSWGSTTQMSDSADTRVISAIVTGDPASASSGNPIIVPTVSYDSHGAYNATTGRYTVQVPGLYKIYGALQSASAATTLHIYKNAVSNILAGNLDSNGEATFSASVNCIAGDIIDLRPGGTVDATAMSLNIERLSGPSQIAASETAAVTAYLSANQTGVNPNNSSVKLNFNATTFDTHGAWNTATYRYTIPSAGKYAVAATVLVASTNVLGNDYILYVYKNGVQTHVIAREWGIASGALGLQGTVNMNLVAGDYLEFYLYGQGNNSASTLTVVGTAGSSTVSIHRIGL